MGNQWVFGWDAIGTIVGILAFLGFIIVEWEKISNAIYSEFFFYFIIFCGMLFVGYSILQTTIFWKLTPLAVVGVYGLLIGVLLGQINLSFKFSDSFIKERKKIVIILLVLGFIGLLSGVWISVL
jgi:hypothetical protein